jgi:dTDP-4-dehydrorhamnose reductase
VADQRGCPTFAGDLARALLELAARAEDGVLHFCGEGETSRHGFAEAIVAAARARGPIAAEEIEAIASAEQPGAARRPPRVVLDTGRIRSLGIEPRPWRAGLDEVMDGLATSTSP